MPIKEILSSIAIVLTFYAFYPYIRSILKGDIKPHVFSWVIWGSTTVIVFFTQIEGGGGVGVWSTGVSGLITFYVAYLAYTNKGNLKITKLDWAFFISAMMSLPLWFFTSDPLIAVIVLTFVDTAGLGPTLRKAYDLPNEERASFYALIALRNGISIMALEIYSMTTVLFPAAVAVFCLLLIVVIIYRRKVLLKGIGQ